MVIGCLFGTFDPPHIGHVAVAEHMLAHGNLDEVWLVVTPQNPFKKDKVLSPDHHRLAMVRLAVQGHTGLVASGFELDLPEPSYTVDSLEFMRRRWPQHQFVLIIGSDNLAQFHQWKDATEILEHHRLLVYPRDGFKEHLAHSDLLGHPAITFVADAPLVHESGTAIRDTIRLWEPVNDRIDPMVLGYIRRNGLYKP
ncbi:MAG: nicotinate (nicotinamide) nucleotide adenylyltransferase [Flavobacteriales bacterium]|nr:nicotinate (nicotinamide) nucleotide adenylyltransferase [Flavobacteriales bacterium]